eukprot:Skav230307  [mRNA]  locus=scaffold430:77424:88782:+ [translate_table: standard]
MNCGNSGVLEKKNWPTRRPGQAALRQERLHRRALYQEVRRLTPKTWRQNSKENENIEDVKVDKKESKGRSNSQVRLQRCQATVPVSGRPPPLERREVDGDKGQGAERSVGVETLWAANSWDPSRAARNHWICSTGSTLCGAGPLPPTDQARQGPAA